MITDRIFISSSKSDEGRRSISQLTSELSHIKRSFDFFKEADKTTFVNYKDEKIIWKRLESCGVTILILSSDFLWNNGHLLRNNEKGSIGWNYEELKASLTWNNEKMHNSVIAVYTDEFFYNYIKNPKLFSFPILNDNLNNLNRFRSADVDSKDYIEVISLKEFLDKPKYYLNKVDKRKVKQSFLSLYNIAV
ncbi:MAG: hypothetical protein ACRCWU_02620 [Metamycoplasmataceae bacterium]